MSAPATRIRTDLHPDRYRKLLDQERARLLGELGELSERDSGGGEGEGEGPNAELGLADQATDLFLREQDEAIHDTLRAEVELVDAAAAKLDAGTYGICERCGVDIPAPRLGVRPAAQFCVPCADLV